MHPDSVPPALSVTSRTLLERIRTSDSDAWARFVALYCPLVYDACRKYGVQPADADDVTQEVLRSVSSGIHEFRKERPGDSFRGWLYRIVQNKVRDHYRRATKRPAAVGGTDFHQVLEQLPEELSQDSVSTLGGTDPALMRALDLIREDIEERTWTIFWRMTVEEHAAAEIAADLGMTRNAVRQAKHRVLLRLRAEFGELIELPR